MTLTRIPRLLFGGGYTAEQAGDDGCFHFLRNRSETATEVTLPGPAQNLLSPGESLDTTVPVGPAEVTVTHLEGRARP